jgi:hypothetical protein
VNDIQQAKLRRLMGDFDFYARNCLQIRTKADAIQPLDLNNAQRYVHKRIEQQRKETGKVRAIILKGRQQGVSTYVEGRFLWRTTMQKAVRAYILTHEEEATQNLFDMTKRYYDSLPGPLRPTMGASNAKELIFSKLDSGFKVGTAGNRAVGRSQTNQYFHGSEVAFWPNAAEHAKGILQTVPDASGTEVIYESTANGVGNFFHTQWKMAESGESEFLPIFVSWLMQEEYTRDVPDDFAYEDEGERELAELHGMTKGQVMFRRHKIRELSVGGGDGEKAFMQEYPLNAAEAFQVSGEDGLITALSCLKARRANVTPSGSLIVGVDPSRGRDRFSLIRRCGRKAYGVESYTGESVNTLGKAVAHCKAALDNLDEIAGRHVDMMFIDAGGGAEIVDRLHELGYQDRVKAIYFGATPLDAKKYTNKRGEMWGLMSEWLNDEHLEVEIPDRDELQADLCASPFDRDSHDRKALWKKDRIKSKYGFSPDEGDALALTFAEPVVKDEPRERKRRRGSSGGWMG